MRKQRSCVFSNYHLNLEINAGCSTEICQKALKACPNATCKVAVYYGPLFSTEAMDQAWIPNSLNAVNNDDGSSYGQRSLKVACTHHAQRWKNIMSVASEKLCSESCPISRVLPPNRFRTHAFWCKTGLKYLKSTMVPRRPC